MPVRINGQTYYRTAEACQRAGTSKNTFFRLVRSGIISDVGLRDRRGWRLFGRDDLKRLKAEVNRLGIQGSAAGGVSLNEDNN